jgi:carboxyl-terminal processing protease
MKRSMVFGVVLVALVLNLALGANIFFNSSRPTNNTDSAQASLDVFNDAMQKIHGEYVNGKNLTYRQLVYSALKGAVSKLDPHSEFLDADSYQELQDDTEGQFGGVGLMVGMKDGAITVIAPMDDTPGARAGILSGDRIVKVEGKGVEKTDLADVVKMLRGDPGSTVSLTIQRRAIPRRLSSRAPSSRWKW